MGDIEETGLKPRILCGANLGTQAMTGQVKEVFTENSEYSLLAMVAKSLAIGL